jgi:hypothetical protein
MRSAITATGSGSENSIYPQPSAENSTGRLPGSAGTRIGQIVAIGGLAALAFDAVITAGAFLKPQDLETG